MKIRIQRKLEQIINEAKSVNETLENLDKQAREIKNSKNKDFNTNFLADAQVKSNLARFQSYKSNVIQQATSRIQQVISRNLQEDDRNENAWKKLQDYVETTVKSQMQVVETKSSSKSEKKDDKDVAFIKTSTKKSTAQIQVGNAYLYSTAWNDGTNVFGAGTITEQYASATSYLVTVTATSPSGRTNTTSGGWDYATLSNNAGLSMTLESGTYNIQADFDADLGGYYDEWGNYYSYGSYNVGSLTSTTFADPGVSVVLTVAEPIVASAGQSGSNPIIGANISTGDGVPAGTCLIIQLYEAKANSLEYTVSNISPVVEERCEVPEGRSGRTTAVKTRATGTVNSFSQLFRISVVRKPTPDNSKIIKNNVYIEDAFYYNGVTKVPVPVGTRSKEVTFTYFPQNVGGGGGGGGGGGCGSCGFAGLGCIGCAVPGAPGTVNGCVPPFFNNSGCCCQGSPIILDIDGNGFAMTNGANGVSFDIGGDGVQEQTSWTTANSDDAWLALDRDNNHMIDNGKELFGNYCDQPEPPAGVLRNGFTGLAEFDKAENGGNGDGKITRADAVFRRLRLWQDKNHNGISEPEELSKLPALDVVALFLDYRESRRTDEFGNRFKFRAKVRDARGARVGRWAYDVFVVPPTPTN